MLSDNTKVNQLPKVSLLPKDVGYDLKELGIPVNLPPELALTVAYVNSAGMVSEVTDRLSIVYRTLQQAGYQVNSPTHAYGMRTRR